MYYSTRPMGPGPAATRLWKITLIVLAGAVPAFFLPELLGGLAFGAAGLMAYALGELR